MSSADKATRVGGDPDFFTCMLEEALPCVHVYTCKKKIKVEMIVIDL